MWWQPADWYDEGSPEETGFYQAFYDEGGNLIGVVGAPATGALGLPGGFGDVGFGDIGFGDEPGEWTIGEDPHDPGEDPDGGGGTGVREPRRPLPGAPFTAAEADPEEST